MANLCLLKPKSWSLKVMGTHLGFSCVGPEAQSMPLGPLPAAGGHCAYGLVSTLLGSSL